MTADAHAIYERHVRRLPVAERLRLLALITEDLADCTEKTVEAPDGDLMELRGLGKECWAGIDAQEYVNALREGRPYPGERSPDAE
jgi:hypothetical protein